MYFKICFSLVFLFTLCLLTKLINLFWMYYISTTSLGNNIRLISRNHLMINFAPFCPDLHSEMKQMNRYSKPGLFILLNALRVH